jgi:DNA polymerase-3 subunit epsilon
VRLAFVDLETTGGNPLVDRVTEVGVVLVDENGVHDEAGDIFRAVD